MKRALTTLPLALALLAGCSSSSPEAEVRRGVESVIVAANDEDAVGVRLAVDDLIALLRDQTQRGEITPQEAQAVANAARAVRDRADLLEVEPTPTPTPTPTPEPEPTEEPSPSPSPEPVETEEPEPSPTPEPVETQEPVETEEPDDDDEPIVELSTTPASQSSPSTPSASPQPTA